MVFMSTENLTTLVLRDLANTGTSYLDIWSSRIWAPGCFDARFSLLASSVLRLVPHSISPASFAPGASYDCNFVIQPLAREPLIRLSLQRLKLFLRQDIAWRHASLVIFASFFFFGSF